MVGRELYDPVAQSDILRQLACSGEEHLRLRRVGVLLKEMVLHFPGVVVAEPVSQLDLGQRVLIQLPLVIRTPRPR